MKETALKQVAFRYQALYIETNQHENDTQVAPTKEALAFIKLLNDYGYSVSEALLHALYRCSVEELNLQTEVIKEALGVDFNWTPLVKNWQVPTNESTIDHLITLFVNCFPTTSDIKGTLLGCGHFIPTGTFNIERYNGCPFCGTPLEHHNDIFVNQGSEKKELRLFQLSDLERKLNELLSSKTPLNKTQLNTLTLLLTHFDVSEDAPIEMKETRLEVMKAWAEQQHFDRIGSYISSPTDLLRFLWFLKTNQSQIIQPKTLLKKASKHRFFAYDEEEQKDPFTEKEKELLKFKYNRTWCKWAATWLNNLPMSAEKAAEIMNPQRGMWVRMIRALRLPEYSKRKGFDALAQLLDVFYNKNYTTWLGKVNAAKQQNDHQKELELLKQRPGMFARALFSTMLRIGIAPTLSAFKEVSGEISLRLLTSLYSAAETYFIPNQERLIRTITGSTYTVHSNPLLTKSESSAYQEYIDAIKELYINALENKYKSEEREDAIQKVFIDPELMTIPISVGNRTSTIQNAGCALMGTRFNVQGNQVRLFLNWGVGLPAQHLDMDLSCNLSLKDGTTDVCSFYNLSPEGCLHSGDIRTIPEKIGTAEYIELDLDKLSKREVAYVTFTCNAYTDGSLSPNMRVGWMNSANKMTISEETGVAFDPSTVQHMVTIASNNLSKGLAFGVLDVDKREITWLELPLSGPTVQWLNNGSVELLLQQLRNKPTIGELLQLKAKAQGIEITTNKDEADMVYDYNWALDVAQVSNTLL